MTPRRLFLPDLGAAAPALMAAFVLAAAGLLGAPLALAQAAEVGVLWQDLGSSHRAALKPLEAQWQTIGAEQKQKWVELAARFPALSPEERSRIQGRMAEWAQLSPRERGQARINFQEAKQVSPQDRQAQWEAYQALPAEQKRQLAARAEPVPKESSRLASPSAQRPSLSTATADEAPVAKSNIVPNPAHAQPPRQVAPGVS
jgi:hypothetical protein